MFVQVYLTFILKTVYGSSDDMAINIISNFCNISLGRRFLKSQFSILNFTFDSMCLRLDIVRQPILKFFDIAVEMQAEALTAVGNVVLDFTPQKQVIMQTDGIAQLINLAQSMDHTLRRNAVLALKNLLFMADITVKCRVMAELTMPTLCDLIQGKSGLISYRSSTS